MKQLPPAEIMQFIETLYARPTREYQYVAIEMALRSVRWGEPADMEHLLTLVLKKFGGTASMLGEKYLESTSDCILNSLIGLHSIL